MVRDRDEETGEFKQEYDDAAFIKVIKQLDLASTKQVSEEVGCSYTLAYHRLKELSSQGEIKQVDVGNSFAWIIA